MPGWRPPTAWTRTRYGSPAGFGRRFGRRRRSPTFTAAGAPSIPDPLFHALFQHYARPEAWRRYDDSEPVLRTLRAEGYALAIVSNFDGRLGPVLEGLGLRSCLDAVVCSAHAGVAKPDPRIFHHALALLARTPAEALHVGDDPVIDVAGARAAGLHAALIRRTEPESIAAEAAGAGTPILATLAELPGLLTRLSS
jgi:putative hydrolase of the HAD superfamily